MDWRPGWVQIDVIAPRTTCRDARSTETLHTTPPPAEHTPQPAGEPELVPADVITSVHTVLAYNWTKEQHNYDAPDPEGQEHHIANDLNRIAQHWDLDPITD
ncbi:hypothetical protein ACH419_36590 [Streptomyces bobili]|uniref:hypothetical protein n=1 Tax=Streptomyces bobili TaxID=67280 RepID=UPI0037BB3F17